jgi:hypothetical protein
MSSTLEPFVVILGSSANIFADVYDKQFGRSFIYRRNSSGPKLDPWGTPQRMVCYCDLVCPILHICVRFVKYDLNQL